MDAIMDPIFAPQNFMRLRCLFDFVFNFLAHFFMEFFLILLHVSGDAHTNFKALFLPNTLTQPDIYDFLFFYSLMITQVVERVINDTDKLCGNWSSKVVDTVCHQHVSFPLAK